ncbi:hypothetical protein Tsubulata_046464 [Turnera subulata]|uniref:BZIP domain-containing protein n=1 Tax=Turnera subulata TaxID=218843 RepID=A0A9Q0FPZ7_9ROSI|nr:hypothetical protein Tsubulata_046464 [Turnera subulata]
METHEIKGLHCVPPGHANSLQNLFTLPSTHKPYPTLNNNQNMQPIESTSHALPHANLAQNPESSSSYLNRILSNSLIHVPLHMISPTTSPLSNNADSTTLNDQPTRDHHHNQQPPDISNEKRLRRMISNRESARRSRMRRKRQIEDLQSRVNHLQAMNHQLSEKVIHLLENNHQVLQDNSQLKEKISSLQAVLSELLTPMRNVEESACNTNRLRGETSNRSSIHH